MQIVRIFPGLILHLHFICTKFSQKRLQKSIFSAKNAPFSLFHFAFSLHLHLMKVKKLKQKSIFSAKNAPFSVFHFAFSLHLHLMKVKKLKIFLQKVHIFWKLILHLHLICTKFASKTL